MQKVVGDWYVWYWRLANCAARNEVLMRAQVLAGGTCSCPNGDRPVVRAENAI